MANPRTNEVARTDGYQNVHGPFSPRIDVMQHEDKVVIRADLPGLESKDIRVTCDRGALIIEGERHSERVEQESEMLRVERTHGRFQRVIALPEGADATNADAHFENGVLEITIPAPLKDRGKQIEVKPG
jgi:HSP20 family protein